MIAYNKTLREFNHDINTGVIADEIVSNLHIDVSESERRSYKNSLSQVSNALRCTDIPDDVQIALEYKVPLTNKRVDFIIAGCDENGNDHVVICELKQWESVMHTDMPDIVRVGDRDMVHPSWQAYTYGSTISNFNEFVESGEVEIDTCTFLHNYRREYADEILNPVYSEGISKAEPFIGDQYEDFARFVNKYIKKSSERDLMFEVENGRIRPSKMLADSLASMLNGNSEYDLIDEQRIVYSNILTECKKAARSNMKQVFIVRGGAGTGKSLIAIQLLSSLIRESGLKTFYVAKSSYVKEAYFAKLTKNVPQHAFLKTLFKGSGNFIDSLNNEFDVLLVDEAHRLTEKTKVSWMFKGDNQIREIIHASKVSVFFIDETQNVDIKDFGTIENIKKAAEMENAEVREDEKYRLASQFRCNGSDDYIAWLEAVLYNGSYTPSGLKVDYDIRVSDDICAVRDEILKRNQESDRPSRMLSGDVFEWKSMDDKAAIDIEIGDFKAQWNKGKSFATDPKSVNEVGCIHTSQGMEFEYAGLIIADDLLYRDGGIVTDYTKHPKKAGEFRRPHQQKVKAEDSEQIDRIIRNTYKVLMTRGQKGCVLYVMDPELRDYLKQRIEDLKMNRVF